MSALAPAPEPLERTTARLVVRPLRLADYEVWSGAMRARQPSRNRFDPGRPADEKLTRDAFEQKVFDRRELRVRDLQYVFDLFHRETGEHVGSVDLVVLTRLHIQVANLGWQVNNTHWRQGYAREAVPAVIDMAFKSLRLHRLEAGVEPENEPSMALARALGLVHERLAKRYLWDGERWIDLVFFVAHAEDWGGEETPPTFRTRLGE